MSLFIGLRGINGTLAVFLGLLTDFKRKLDLTVVAIPPKAGKSLPLLCNRKPAYTALAQWPQGQIRLKSVRKPCCSSLKLIYRQNLDLISIFLNYSFLIHRDNDQIGAFEFSRTFYDAIYLPLERSFGR